jgi:hypothetical protein
MRDRTGGCTDWRYSRWRRTLGEPDATGTRARPYLNHGVSHGIGVAVVGCISDELGAKTLVLRGSA